MPNSDLERQILSKENQRLRERARGLTILLYALALVLGVFIAIAIVLGQIMGERAGKANYPVAAVTATSQATTICGRATIDRLDVRYEPDGALVGYIFAGETIELRRQDGEFTFVYGLGVDEEHHAKTHLSGWVEAEFLTLSECP